MRRQTLYLMATLLAGLVMACSGDDYKDPPTGVDAGPDTGTQQDAIVDVADLPDRIINPDGPDITIESPQPMTVLSGNQAQVVVIVTDPDGVNVSSVRAVIPGGASFNLSRSGTVDDQYSGNIDLSELPTTDSMYLFVEAADLLGTWNSADVQVRRDTGPIVVFTSPEDGERYAGSVNVSFQVADPNGVLESSVRAEVSSVPLTLTKQSEDTDNGTTPTWINFIGEIVFDDPMFVPPLQSTHQIIVTAENIENHISAESTVTFVVDDEGPVITVNTPLPGEIVGGIINIEAEVVDEAGVLNTSVVAVLGGNANEYIVPLVSVGGVFTGTFDTTQFPSNYIFPPLSIRAADMLNNESSVGFVLALDNTAPVLSLDPPPNMRLGLKEAGVVTCSLPFDPVGAANPNDGTTVPQIHFMRARIEDRGNYAVGLLQVPLSLVNYATPRVYWLPSTSQALVVDTDGDGYCDEINPELIPSTNPQGSDEILALNLESIEPSGAADFMYSGNLPTGCDEPGEETEPPVELCIATQNEQMSVAIFYTVDPTEPAIWSLPLIDSDSALFCTGHQFDNYGSNIPEGWVCVAARAVDNAGNIGISKPIRICVDYTLDGNPATCGNPADMPDCTGTIDPQTQLVDPAVPCIFDPDTQQFPDEEVRIKL
jgi:hypothetical protein